MLMFPSAVRKLSIQALLKHNTLLHVTQRNNSQVLSEILEIPF